VINLNRDQYITWHLCRYGYPPSSALLEKYFPKSKEIDNSVKEIERVPEDFWRDNPLDG
jgi:hypothetical protein